MGTKPKESADRKVSNTIQKWWAVAASCTVALLGGYFCGNAHQLFGTFRYPDTCTLQSEVVVTTDCVAHRMLLATEAGASATQIYMWLTFVGLAISVFTLVGLLMTLRLNRDVLKAAIQANAVATRNGQAQVRAYVVIDSVFARLGRDASVRVQPKFFNSGQSPAHQFRWTMRAKVNWVDTDETPKTSFSRLDADLDGSVWRSELAAHTPLTPPPLELKREGVPVYLPSSGASCPVAVEINAEYTDVFGEQHTIKSSFVGSIPMSVHGHENMTEINRAADEYFEQELAKLPS